MNRLGISLRNTLLVGVLVLTLVAGTDSSASASTPPPVTGTLPNGAVWIADVPSDWNGILVLYSHGFGPPLPANAPDQATRDALLARGYALAGSSYDPSGSWWALNTAVDDQFATIGAVTAAALPHEPERVLAQYASAVQSFPLLNFIQFGRYWIELAAGGNGSWTRGEDFAELLTQGPFHDVVRRLYRTAGLDLKADLKVLDAGAAIGADPDAIASLEETSVPTGKLRVPELTLHTTADPLVPVQHENVYGGIVRLAGANSMLRQAYVDRWGPCSFTPAELVAGLEAVRYRVETGRWDSVAQPQTLRASASALGLGDAAFVHYQPAALSGANGSFDLARNGR